MAFGNELSLQRTEPKECFVRFQWHFEVVVPRKSFYLWKYMVAFGSDWHLGRKESEEHYS